MAYALRPALVGLAPQADVLDNVFAVPVALAVLLAATSASDSDGVQCAPRKQIKGHYFKETGSDPEKPWVDIFEGAKAYDGKNVTFMAEWLAFKSPQFQREHQEEWMDVVLSLPPGALKRASQKDSATYERVKKAREASAGVRNPGDAAPAFSAASVLVSGRAAALQVLASQGQRPVEMQRMTDLQIQVANEALMRWVVLANLPLHCLNHPAWREFVSLINVVYAPRSLNYDLIRRGNYLDRMFIETRTAVEEVLSKARCVFTITDGWTSDKETLINACDFADGNAWWAYQKTPKAVSHTAECYYTVCAASLSRANNYGAVCDNPDTMRAFRGLVVNRSGGKKYAAACTFHVADLLPGDLMGMTGAHTKEYTVPELLSASDKSVTSFAREVQKFFSNRSVPKDLLHQGIVDFNVLQKAAGREERAVTLKAMANTRKASVANLYNSVAASTGALRTTVNSHPFGLYKLGLNNTAPKAVAGASTPAGPSERQRAQKLTDDINRVGPGSMMEQVKDFGLLFAQYQIYQRVCEMPHKNFADCMFDFGELLRRLADTPNRARARAEEGARLGGVSLQRDRVRHEPRARVLPGPTHAVQGGGHADRRMDGERVAGRGGEGAGRAHRAPEGCEPRAQDQDAVSGPGGRQGVQLQHRGGRGDVRRGLQHAHAGVACHQPQQPLPRAV